MAAHLQAAASDQATADRASTVAKARKLRSIQVHQGIEQSAQYAKALLAAEHKLQLRLAAVGVPHRIGIN